MVMPIKLEHIRSNNLPRVGSSCGLSAGCAHWYSWHVAHWWTTLSVSVFMLVQKTPLLARSLHFSAPWCRACIWCSIRRAANRQKVRYFRSLNGPPTHTWMLYHWKALHLPVMIRPVVELPSGAVSGNSRSNKVTVKRSILETARFRKRLDI